MRPDEQKSIVRPLLRGIDQQVKVHPVRDRAEIADDRLVFQHQILQRLRHARGIFRNLKVRQIHTVAGAEHILLAAAQLKHLAIELLRRGHYINRRRREESCVPDAGLTRHAPRDHIRYLVDVFIQDHGVFPLIQISVIMCIVG